MHMRLLAKHNRNPNEISINAQLKKDDDGKYVVAFCCCCVDRIYRELIVCVFLSSSSIINNVCEVVVVSLDRDSLLDAITRYVLVWSCAFLCMFPSQ